MKRLAYFFVFVFIFISVDSRADGLKSEITGIEVFDHGIRVNVNGPINYQINKVDPFRLFVDINAMSGSFKDRLIQGRAGITEVKVSDFTDSNISRLDILLHSPADAEAEIKDGSLIISLKREGTFSLSKKEDVVGNKVNEMEEDLASEIIEVLFNKTDRGAELILKGDGVMPEPSVIKASNSIIVDVPDVIINAKIPNILSPVKSISQKIEKGKTRFIIDLDVKADADVYAIDDEIVIELSESQKKEEKAALDNTASETSVHNSRLISLDFQDADIVPIIRLLGEVGGYNIIVHPDVKGKITTKLLNVPWHQALDVIVKTFNLEKIVEGNIIRIQPAVERAKPDLEVERLISEVFYIKHADISVVEKVLKDAKVLSERGGIGVMRQSIDLGKFKEPKEENISPKSTGMLIVTDTPSIISRVREIIKKIDVPEPQIYIEAKIVEVNDKFLRDIGVQWGLMWLSSNWRDSALGSISNTPVTGGQFPVAINLPAGTTTNPATSAITFGYLNAAQTFGLDLRLSAAEATGKLKIVSSPKIMTLNNEMAVIRHGAQVPIATPGSVQGTFTTTYKDAALKLKIVPQVIDDSIFLKVEVNKDEPNYAFVDINQNPRIDSRSASTQVLIKDGETIVIGGIQKTSETDNEDSVPGISKVPILGWLFKRHTKETASEELVVFITPRIVRQ